MRSKAYAMRETAKKPAFIVVFAAGHHRSEVDGGKYFPPHPEKLITHALRLRVCKREIKKAMSGDIAFSQQDETNA